MFITLVVHLIQNVVSATVVLARQLVIRSLTTRSVCYCRR